MTEDVFDRRIRIVTGLSARGFRLVANALERHVEAFPETFGSDAAVFAVRDLIIRYRRIAQRHDLPKASVMPGQITAGGHE